MLAPVIPSRAAAAMAMCAWLCACASPSTSVEPVPEPSDQAEAQECPAVDLFSPAGATVNLTGKWRSNDLGAYDLHQSGSCFYWLGQSRYLDSQVGEFWTNVLVGTIGSDFSITARWGNVPYLNTELWNGEMTLRIGFDSADGQEFPVLRTTAVTGGFWGSAWVPEDSLPPPADLAGIFSGNYDHLLQTGCLWVQVGDVRYELLGDGGWVIRGDPPLRIEDGRGRVYARDGDMIRVNGIVSPGLGRGCVESSVLVEGIDFEP